MNPLKSFCLMACLLAVASASHSHKQGNSASNNLKPSSWLSASELESLPSLDEVTLEQLQSMSAEKGAKLVDKLYHLAQMNHELKPGFVPSPSNIPATIVRPNGQLVETNLNEMVAAVKQQSNFGDDEVTILITGLPESIPSVKKANRKLVHAYEHRYGYTNHKSEKQGKPSSDEDYSTDSWNSRNTNTGDIVVIDLGATLTNFKRIAMLDTVQTGNMIGKALVELTNENDIPQEIIHVIGQGVGANVAGAAARQYTRLTGHQLRRVTGLDPAKIITKNPNTLAGLARGDAKFVDAIHTSAYGLGTAIRTGDIDFYPNGPCDAAPGTENVFEASMRAARYFAESVRPGNERNFPAVAADSIQQYNNQNGNGRRAYMGIATDFDLEGDYILQVNPSSPFGKSAPAQKQNTYHGVHQAWKNSKSQDY